ncbi:TetR/AcrR family transcriptional regulator [uncultured Brevibacillus sp.]|uniref:TetR/AcrR family transcriptional regulator n=1 Tax=uncultured Brevibacillus sp. TaxID=169970 RepID=UPI00259AA8AC|nr:TetR/AcrR family transcriptional regulator [uncultured Brevibacillus sp.]
MDLRKRRSMQMLWKALFDLMTEQMILFSKITVDQICERAMVHRSTFYKHFDDKFNLLEYGLNQLMERYWELPLEKRIVKPFFWSNEFFEGSESHKLVRTQQRDELFLDCMTNYSMRLLKKDAFIFFQHSKTIDIPQDLLAEFHVSATIALSVWWRKDPERVSLTQLDQYFHKLVNEKIYDLGEDGPMIVPKDVNLEDTQYHRSKNMDGK